jgi:hypothetical protein
MFAAAVAAERHIPCVVIERKALSRVIHNLKDSQLGIYTDKHRGTWHMGGLPEET